MRVTPLCFLLLLGFVSCKRKDGKRKSDSEKYKTLPNLCDNENRESPLMCTCDQTELLAASSASCWVLPLPLPAEPNHLTWGQFQSQTNLQELKLSVRAHSHLTEMPTEVLQSLRKLQILEIQYGNIHEVHPYALANASHLREAVLSRNNIAVLHPNAFAYLMSLDSLSLEDNSIAELQPMVFHHVPNLRKLFLSRNNLSIVHDNAFRFMNHLHELELNTNAISIITRETFNGLFHLRRLDLTGNRLAMIGDLTFAEIPELQELELDNNALEFISERAFAGLPMLNRLRLADNRLKVLADHLFDENLSIQFLDLRDNSMEQLKFNTLQPLWENFKNLSTHLLLEGNQFPCDCHLSWMYSLRNETPNKQVKSVLEELTCIVSEDMVTNDEPAVSSSEQQDDQFAANGVEYEEGDVEYEELPEEEGPPRRRIFDIPQEKLPCPEMLEAPAESPKATELPSRADSANTGHRFRESLFLLPAALCASKTAFTLFLT